MVFLAYTRPDPFRTDREDEDMGRWKSIGRNPHAERYKALALDELRIGMRVVVIGGGLYYHEHMTIASLPYVRTKRTASIELHNFGQPVTVKDLMIKVRDESSPFRDSTLPSWLPAMERRHRQETKERFLGDMGLCPDRSGRWSGKYTVLLKDYDPHGLHS